MSGLVYALGAVLFLLGVLISIALHEVGHMVPAKLFGVKVTQYMVGFGRTVWSVQKGDTEYGVKVAPLGGYIRMLGMLPPERRDENGRVRGIRRGFFGRLIADARAAEEERITPADHDRLFYTRPWWQKIIIMAGGPSVNIVLAVLLLSIAFVGIGVQKPSLTVGGVSDCVIPATQGLRPCRVPPAPHPDPVAPASTAGFHAGDQIVSLNGRPMRTWGQFAGSVRTIRHGTVTVVVERHGHPVTLRTQTTVTARPDPHNPSRLSRVGFLGLTPAYAPQRQGFGYVTTTIWQYTKHTGVALVTMPQRMVGVFKAALGLEPRSMQSPMSVVGASRVAGQVASDSQISVGQRLYLLLTLLGIVNLFVALFNFIPLLPLDGGHIAGALYEAVRRGLARLRGRPDPGHADIAQLLPIAYAAATVLIAVGAVLVWADIVNPIRLPQ